MSDEGELAPRLVDAGVTPDVARWCAERYAAGDPTELLQLLLLRALWAQVRPVGESRFLAERAAAARLIENGATPDDVAALVHATQVRLLHDICRVLDEGGRSSLPEQLGAALSRGLGWAVVAQDPRQTPASSLGGLHSTLGQLDPGSAK